MSNEFGWENTEDFWWQDSGGFVWDNPSNGTSIMKAVSIGVMNIRRNHPKI